MKIRRIFSSLLLGSLTCFSFNAAFAQAKTDSIAEKMLIYQRSYGGWPKAINEKKVVYEKPLSENEKREIKKGLDTDDGTFDNKATSREINYLVKAYKQTSNPEYLKAAQKGIDYILKAQYANGGWPQYYPKNNLYRGQITFNDDAMVNVLNILQDIVEKTNDFDVVDASYIPRAKEAVEKGTSCILKTQIRVNGKLTAWAAQYDEKSLTPAKARAFEPASLSSSESAGIIRFLMRLPNPSPEMKLAVSSGVSWFDQVKISGYTVKQVDAPALPKGKDRVVVKEDGATIWARFYEIDTFKPIFIGRDSVIRYNLSEIDPERRNGYAWYGNWGTKLIEKDFPKWKQSKG